MKRINSKINLETAVSRAKFLAEHQPGVYMGKSAPDTVVYITIENKDEMVVRSDKQNTNKNRDRIIYNRDGKIKYVDTDLM